MATLSLCMIVKDESAFLEHCIDSVKDVVDEIVIGVDSRSKDNTREMAKRLGNIVFDFDWADDFSKARNLTLDKATSNWILVLDADELVDEEGKKEISRLINDRENCLNGIIGFKVDQRTHHKKPGIDAKMSTDSKMLKSGFSGFESSKLVRLFKNHPKIRFRNKVHELVEGSITDSKGDIIQSAIIVHHFSELKGSIKKNEKTGTYADLIWKQLEDEPENPRHNRTAALAFLDAGRKDLALKYFMRAVKFNPNIKGVYSHIGRIYLEKGDVDNAIKFFNVAVGIDKNDTASINNLAFIYMNLGKLDTAKALLEKAIAKDPDNAVLKENFKKLKEKMSKK